jgi:hypothetical protein
MPSPTPPREVRCEACGSSAPHSKESPMPRYYGAPSLGEFIRWLMATDGCCVPGCTGCSFPRAK